MATHYMAFLLSQKVKGYIKLYIQTHTNDRKRGMCQGGRKIKSFKLFKYLKDFRSHFPTYYLVNYHLKKKGQSNQKNIPEKYK